LQVAVESFPAANPRLQDIRWLWLSANSSARATETITDDNATPQQIFRLSFIRIIPTSIIVNIASRLKPDDSREAGCGKSQSLWTLNFCKRRLRIDGTMAFVICSSRWQAAKQAVF
jgi:hypothetical protein